MPKVTIVSHCWAERHSQYAVFLRAQLSSLIVFPPGVDFAVRVCCTVTDHRTTRVIDDLADRIQDVSPVFMTQQELWRRSIGRNTVALSDIDSDLIWFCDVDYLFGKNCLSVLCQRWTELEKPDMVWPQWCFATKKEDIDFFSKACEESRGTILPNLEETQPMTITRAIGGVQIVSGKYARRFGYLNGHEKWQRPTDIPFQDFRDDVKFRDVVLKCGVCAPIGIPGLYRLRHTEVGYGVQNPA